MSFIYRERLEFGISQCKLSHWDKVKNWKVYWNENLLTTFPHPCLIIPRGYFTVFGVSLSSPTVLSDSASWHPPWPPGWGCFLCKFPGSFSKSHHCSLDTEADGLTSTLVIRGFLLFYAACLFSVSCFLKFLRSPPKPSLWRGFTHRGSGGAHQEPFLFPLGVSSLASSVQELLCACDSSVPSICLFLSYVWVQRIYLGASISMLTVNLPLFLTCTSFRILLF